MMKGLIKNEIIKLVRQKKLYVFLGIILLITLALLFVGSTIEEETGVVAAGGQAFPLGLLEGMVSLLPLLLLFLVSDMIAGEYSSGTLKLSLLYPVSRDKLLASKMVSILIVTSLLLTFTLMAGYIVGLFSGGWTEGFIFAGQEYTAGTGVLMTLQSYLISILPLYAIGMLYLFLSLLVNNGTAALGLSLVTFFTMTAVSDFVELLRPYLPTSYLQLFQFILLRKEDAGLSELAVSGFVVLLVGIALLAAASFYLFRRKDLLQ